MPNDLTLILKNDNYSLIARTKNGDNNCKIYFSQIGFDLKNQNALIYNGDNFYSITLSEVITLPFNCYKLAILLIDYDLFNTNGIDITKEELLNHFNKKKNSPVYDDEQIADYNYYNIKVEDGKSDVYAFTKDIVKKEKEKGEYQQENKNYEGDNISKNLSNDKDKCLLNFFVYGKRYLPLERLIDNSCVFTQTKNNKDFFIGYILDGDITFACVKGEINKKPKGFENAYFLPQSYFDNEKGYYLIIDNKS